MKIFSYQTIFHKEAEGGYTVTVPALPGCVSYGRTIEEAQVMIKDAISGYIASLKKHKEPIPRETGVFTLAIPVNLQE